MNDDTRCITGTGLRTPMQECHTADLIASYILIVLFIAGIFRFIGPDGSILQPHIDLAAIVNDTIQVGILRCQPQVDGARRF